MYRLDVCFLCVTLTICMARDPRAVIDLPNQGKVKGVGYSKLRIQKITAYYGIPYAQPPIGSFRFAPPVTDPLPRWDDIKQDADYPASCLQSADNIREADKPFLQIISKPSFNLSENCLYLNIFTPYGEGPKTGYATIIWFHPGNFTTGSPAMWNPHTLVYRHRIIVVTVAYRLNILGFLTTMDGESTGNFGLLDQQAAMRWVKNNIELFGGDPNNISIMGYGAGAVSITIHLVNAASRELFNKAIIMSGNIFAPGVVKKPEEYKSFLDDLAIIFGCHRIPTSELMICLRNVPAETLIQDTTNINWGPIIDAELVNSTQPFLPDFPVKYFQSGDFQKVPLLTGYTQMERVTEIESISNLSTVTTDNLKDLLKELINGDIPNINKSDINCNYKFDHITDAVMFFYGPTQAITTAQFRETITDFVTERDYASSTYLLANYMSKYKPTYMYRFDMKPSTQTAVDPLPYWVTVPHLFDLIFIWGVPYWTDLTWDIRDKSFSDTIMAFWTNFAKSSNPTEPGNFPVVWDNFSEDNPGILFIDGKFNMSNSKSLNYKAFEFWNNYYPKVKSVATQCCEILDAGANNIQQDFVKTTIIIFMAHIFLHL